MLWYGFYNIRFFSGNTTYKDRLCKRFLSKEPNNYKSNLDTFSLLDYDIDSIESQLSVSKFDL
jgi:hypothetical protein